jgi:hypothetical protein
MYANKAPGFFQRQSKPIDLDVSNNVSVYSEKDFKQITSQLDPGVPQPKLFAGKCNTQVEESNDKILCGVQESSPFSRLFFSNANVLELQKMIKYQVYLKSGSRHIIDYQSNTELLIVMRGIYLEYAQIPGSVKCYKKEIASLNSRVVNSVLRGIIDGIEGYLGYIKDSSELPTPIALPTSSVCSGNKELRSSTDVLFGDAQFFAQT